MAETGAIDRKIKRLTARETEFHHRIKKARADERSDLGRKQRYERQIAKWERSIEKLLPKVRRLRELRARVRAR
ncbi:MAG TPA: hypothetical protein VJ400_00585 [Thermoplasmata archaeon]|nr:hypothetical protein [Thermoplasmata archaeon]